MAHLKFDLAKISKLDDPGRFNTLRPEVMWAVLGAPSDVRTIVEIGAGTGMFAGRFAALAPHATVYAADNERQMIDWMHANRSEVTEGRIVPVLSEDVHVPLADSIADLVFMINVHHELPEPDAVYAEAFRLTATGGSILIVDWAPIETPRGPSLAVRASPEEIIDFLALAGYSNVHAHEGSLPWHTVVTGEKR